MLSVVLRTKGVDHDFYEVEPLRTLVHNPNVPLDIPHPLTNLSLLLTLFTP